MIEKRIIYILAILLVALLGYMFYKNYQTKEGLEQPPGYYECICDNGYAYQSCSPCPNSGIASSSFNITSGIPCDEWLSFQDPPIVQSCPVDDYKYFEIQCACNTDNSIVSSYCGDSSVTCPSGTTPTNLVKLGVSSCSGIQQVNECPPPSSPDKCFKLSNCNVIDMNPCNLDSGDYGLYLTAQDCQSDPLNTQYVPPNGGACFWYNDGWYSSSRCQQINKSFTNCNGPNTGWYQDVNDCNKHYS